MAYEVDYIPVGNGEKSGDAITLRFGNLTGSREEQTVIVIDGGFEDSGESLVQHIKTYYNTDIVNLAISTHPDSDHISGLCTVLEKLTVKNLLMHKPWDHATEIKSFFKNKSLTSSGLEEKIEKSLQQASDLEDLAIKKGVKVIEPFQGTTGYGVFHVLGPSIEFYESQLALFKSTPAPLEALERFFRPVIRTAEETIEWIEDKLDIDLLDNDEDTTSAENNTSSIILFNLDGHKLLFTGDAGKTALLNAIAYANTQSIILTDLNFFDIPHHGSKRNLSSRVLNNIYSLTAFISAAKDSSKHPAKKVTNALKKKGTKVFVNRNGSIRHHHKAPDRGWGLATEELFYNRVEN